MLIPLCKMVLIVEKRKSVVPPIDTFAKGIRPVIMLPQMSKPILGFKEMLMLAKMGWNLRMKAVLMRHPSKCSSSINQLSMNIFVWNSRGALKPNFQKHVRELVRNHNPTIMVIMETCLGGERDREITDRLPFDDAIHTETIGFTGGLWLLWNSDMVEVNQLANTKQEIHVEVKVHSFNLSWLFSAIYASPRSEEKGILWNNLSKVVELHNKP